MIRCATKSYRNLGTALNRAIEHEDRVAYRCGHLQDLHYHVVGGGSLTQEDFYSLLNSGRLIAG